MEHGQLVIHTILFIFAIGTALFNWIHYTRITRANKEIGLYAPGYIKILIDISSGLAILSALLIIVFLIMDIV